MKKGILFLSFLSLLVFSSCSFFGGSKQDIAYLRFSVQDVEMSFQPDYELRTMAVKYSLSSNISNEGVIGGEFFDRFEEILSSTSKDIWKEQKDPSSPTFTISVEKENGEIKQYDLYTVGDQGVFKMVEQFYLDVIDLFSQDVY